ncbi:MAG: hypothetical protein Q7J35_11060 [Candidatus Methanoperedens sp.]|nr:hypothetical protein [Candidatus Methanoperedens sp.]
MRYSLKHVYIILLVVVVSLLVFIVQGLYQQETKYLKQVEFKRIDGYSEGTGNISEVQARINNQDTVRHNYTVQVSLNSVFFTDEIVEVMPDQPFTFKIVLPVEKQFSDLSVEEALHNVSFIIFRDDRPEPIDRIEYKFD